ncbi:MAG: uncharacterized protein JWQ87_554 [Candidatus Sulfotelmatobacter sp.]|nr:uncharacterized protein [Candidatus Sulfotelmatobacter sp.]
MSKTIASTGWICALCMVPVTIIAVAFFAISPGRHVSTAGTAPAASSAYKPETSSEARGRIQATYAALPLAFEQNQGQSDARVKYLARGNGYTLFLTANDAVLSLNSLQPASEMSKVRPAIGSDATTAAHSNTAKHSNAVVRMHLVGGNSRAKVEGAAVMPGTANYFVGNDQSKWRTGVARYARVSYDDVYPGVSMAFHGTGRALEFDFIVAAGANPDPIDFRITGNQGLKTDNSGNLIISSAAGNVLLHKPVAYQEQNGTHQVIDARFALKANNEVSFKLGDYDRTRELVIDPSVSYSTYLGGSGTDSGYGIAFDSAGNAYVTGETASANFPGFSSTNKLLGTANAFVTKIKPDGSGIVYSTYIGGSFSDSGNAIVVDGSLDAFIAGGTSSSTFPTTVGAYQTILKGTVNAFISELDPSGVLKYSTYLGGSASDAALSIALDSSGNVYTAGKTSSSGFPLSVGTLQATPAGGFLTKLKPAGLGLNDLVFSTYIGGNVNDFATAVAVASGSSPNIYLTGSAGSSFPIQGLGVRQPIYGGGSSDAFVMALSGAGSTYTYVYSTFLGGSNSDIGNGIAVDGSGNAYVTGQTASSTDFPLQSALQATFGGGATDAFVTKVKADGTAFVYSTYLGGNGTDLGAGIAVDGSNNAYVTGQTASNPFPTVSSTQANPGGGNDAFVSEINAGGSALVFSTYLGGSLDEDDGGKFGSIAVDSAGSNIYVSGTTASTSDFPSTTGAFQPVSGGASDAFVVKYSTTASTFSLAATALSPATVSPGGSATSTVTVSSTNGFSGTVTLTCAITPVVTLGPTCAAATATTATPGTLTVNTTPASALLQQPKTGHSSAVFYAIFLPMGGIALLGFAGPRRKKVLGGALLSFMLGSLLLLPACGGGSSTKTTGNAGTPAGNYTITVSGTATAATETGTSPALTLTVN